MTIEYGGLVVGGPLAGHHRFHFMPFFEVEELENVFVEGDVFVQTKRFTYRIHAIYDQHFWIPTGKDLGWLMNELAESYSRLKGLEK